MITLWRNVCLCDAMFLYIYITSMIKQVMHLLYQKNFLNLTCQMSKNTKLKTIKKNYKKCLHEQIIHLIGRRQAIHENQKEMRELIEIHTESLYRLLLTCILLTVLEQDFTETPFISVYFISPSCLFHAIVWKVSDDESIDFLVSYNYINGKKYGYGEL